MKKVVLIIISVMITGYAVGQDRLINKNCHLLINGYGDIELHNLDRKSGGRAFVPLEGDKLSINFEDDFEGGVHIGGSFAVIGKSTGYQVISHKRCYFKYMSTDKIGVGTDSPQSALDVRGKIIANEVEIKINTGADFVFKPDYQLKPLSEVETFVKENQHLPDIPSEKEMQENGLNLNDMQIKLLQKIEELTLYVIEQDKKIESQNFKIAEQQKEINNLKNK